MSKVSAAMMAVKEMDRKILNYQMQIEAMQAARDILLGVLRTPRPTKQKACRAFFEPKPVALVAKSV